MGQYDKRQSMGNLHKNQAPFEERKGGNLGPENSFY